MNVFVSVMLIGIWLFVIGLGAGLGGAIVWGLVIAFAAPAAAVAYYAWLIVFRSPG